MDLKIIITALVGAGVIGIIIAWILNGISFILHLRREDKRKLKEGFLIC